MTPRLSPPITLTKYTPLAAGLITGKASEISDVINDVLGLYTLSQLVPALESVSKEAKAAVDKINGLVKYK